MKRKIIFLSLGIIGVTAMGIGCAAQETQATKERVATRTSSQQPEAINIEVVLKDNQAKEAQGYAAAEAPASPTVTETTTTTCADQTNPACMMPSTNYGTPSTVVDAGMGAPGLGQPGFPQPGFLDVPYGPGFGGPLYGLGYPFYVSDIIAVDDDSHHRRRHHDDDNQDDDNLDEDNQDDDDALPRNRSDR